MSGRKLNHGEFWAGVNGGHLNDSIRRSNLAGDRCGTRFKQKESAPYPPWVMYVSVAIKLPSVVLCANGRAEPQFQAFGLDKPKAQEGKEF